MQRNPLRPAGAFNGRMDPRPLTQDRRSALLQFESVYEDWRQATDAWLAAELKLWTQALGGAGPAQVRRLGADAARLRERARSTYLTVMDSLTHTLPD